jgi:hypothetical protein
MSDEELEKLAELIFQKLVKKEQEYLDNMELPAGWVADDTAGIWYKHLNLQGLLLGKDLLTQRLVALNIEKQELIEQEDYEELIKLQKRIDEIKEQLKKYKD